MDTSIADCKDIDTTATGCASNVIARTFFSYLETIGSLMYLTTGTRPYLPFAIGKLAQFYENPASIHWDARKRVLKYIKGKLNLGFRFSGRDEIDLWEYRDSD